MVNYIMENKREDLIQKILSKVTPDNIDKKLLFYSSLLERLMNRKECYDININTSVKQRACKERLVCNTKPTLKSKDFNEPSEEPLVGSFVLDLAVNCV